MHYIFVHVKVCCDNTGHEDEIYAKLKEHQNLIVYKKEEMAPSYHYKNNRRIMPLVVSAAVGYRLCKNTTVCERRIGNNVISRFNFHCMEQGSLPKVMKN